MAQKFFYAGSMGPYLYDDADTYRSAGYVPGEFREAFITDGQCRIAQAPTHEEHVVRLKDFTITVRELIMYTRQRSYFFSSF